MEAILVKNKTYLDINPYQRRQLIIDVLSQTLAEQFKPLKNPENPQKSSQKALA